MKLLNTPAFWIVVALVAGAAIIVLFRSRSRSEWGFREAVQSSEQWSRDMDRANREWERAVAQAKQWDEAQVTAAVHRFVFDVPSSQQVAREARVLESLGSRIYPSVFQILSGRSVGEKLCAEESPILQVKD